MQRIDISHFRNQNIALVLSGGVSKAAAWHLGVGLALSEIGFTLKSNNSHSNQEYEIGTYVGSSAGALIGLFFACGYSPQEVINSILNDKGTTLRRITYKDMLSFKRPKLKVSRPDFFDPFSSFPFPLKMILNQFLKIPGIFSTHGLYEYIKKNVLISNDFKDYKADLFIVASQLDDSRKVIFGKYKYPNSRHDSTAVYYVDNPVAESIAASMSVPPFYAPYPIWNNKSNQVEYYIDGEIRETLSTHVAEDNNCKFIISSWTHTPYHYHDEVGSLINYGIPAIIIQAIYLTIQKKIVQSRAQRLNAQDTINTISDYFKHNKIGDEHRKKILSILDRKLFFKRDVHLIDICPKAENYELFFANSFTLNPAKNALIMKAGYKRTFEVFKNHEFEN